MTTITTDVPVTDGSVTILKDTRNFILFQAFAPDVSCLTES